MGDYVYSKELGTEAGVQFSFDVFKESNTEYRPILTATYDDSDDSKPEKFGSGFSKRRSFKTESEAKNFYFENESKLKQEARQELLTNRWTNG